MLSIVDQCYKTRPSQRRNVGALKRGGNWAIGGVSLQERLTLTARAPGFWLDFAEVEKFVTAASAKYASTTNADFRSLLDLFCWLERARWQLDPSLFPGTQGLAEHVFEQFVSQVWENPEGLLRLRRLESLRKASQTAGTAFGKQLAACSPALVDAALTRLFPSGTDADCIDIPRGVSLNALIVRPDAPRSYVRKNADGCADLYQLRIDQLRRIFTENRQDSEVLRELGEALRQRKQRKRVIELCQQVDDALNRIENSAPNLGVDHE